MDESKVLMRSIQDDLDDDDDEHAADIEEHYNEMRDDIHEALRHDLLHDEEELRHDKAGGDDFRGYRERNFSEESIDGDGFNAMLDKQRANGHKTTSTPYAPKTRNHAVNEQQNQQSPWGKPVRSAERSNGTMPKSAGFESELGLGMAADARDHNTREDLYDNDPFLRQEYITPQKFTEEQREKLAQQHSNRKLEQYQKTLYSQFQGVTRDLETVTFNNATLLAEKVALQQEVSRLSTALGEQNARVRSFDENYTYTQRKLRKLQEENEELKKSANIKDGKIEEMHDHIKTMTTWETVDCLRVEKERIVLDIKAVQDRQLAEMKEAHAKELSTRNEWLNQQKMDLEEYRTKLRKTELSEHELEDHLRSARREIETLKQELKDLHSTPNKEQPAVDYLNSQLKIKDEEIDRLKKSLRGQEEIFKSQTERYSDTVAKLRTDISRQEQENAHLMDEQVKLKEELVKQKNDHMKADEEIHAARADKVRLQEEKNLTERNSNLEAEMLKSKVGRLETLIADADQQKLELQSTVARLEAAAVETNRQKVQLSESVTSLREQVASKSRIDLRRASLENLQLQLQTKEAAYSDEKRKFNEVTDRLHSQLKDATDDNLRLRDETKRLLSESHTMKKVLKKTKKLLDATHAGKQVSSSLSVSANTTMNGHASSLSQIHGSRLDDFSRDNLASHIQELGIGGDQVGSERKYVRELIIQRGDSDGALKDQYQQQLAHDRQTIIKQIDAVYTKKLQQVLTQMRSSPSIDFSHLNREI